jgi:glutathionyl-hydroquinone reductase
LSNFLCLREGQETDMMIKEIHPYMNELINYLIQAKNIVNLESDEIKKMFNWMNFMKSKKASDVFSREEENQIGLDIQIAYDKVNKSLK